MPIQTITIQQFLELAQQHPVLDVRSPGEFNHAHITGAYSLPLFNDGERKIVGTAYKQQSKEIAIKLGLDFFGVKMRRMVEEVESLIIDRKMLAENQRNDDQPTTNNVLVHCWRGGMRSAAVAWLLDLYGFKVFTLSGGYKAYRNWVLQQFSQPYNFLVVGGYTGSGKTLLLKNLAENNKAVIDLEALANHKGSALGGLDEKKQPSQEMFENKLAEALTADRCSMTAENTQPTINGQRPTCIFIEDESQRIGNLQIPMPLWQTMRSSPVYFLDVPFEERLNFLTQEYSIFTKEKLVNAIIRIQKRLGGLETKNAINFLLENNHKECFSILLRYYDKWYLKGLHNRENITQLIHNIPCSNVDTITNAQKLMEL
ncbi:MAG: tRNA 2-selenouridine(34) synthase MnmH [Chitinophagaceae bacterium]|nr:tRNA 2-selenouridine(34) synthase MnmH [Chitinophagaceae bacterium]